MLNLNISEFTLTQRNKKWNEYKRLWYHKNGKEGAKQYYIKNRNRILKKQNIYYQKNKHRISKLNKLKRDILRTAKIKKLI